MSERVNISETYPPARGETPEQYTVRLTGLARTLGVFRQCSIGYHDECSDQYGDECQCSCHALGAEISRAQLEAWCGRDLSDEEVMLIEEAIPNSGIPESIRTISENL